MSFIQMRTVPGLFIGRRTVIAAQPPLPEADQTGYRCGACDSVILATADPADLRDVVVKCGCGEINQL
ncbi:MAG: hypothetical protein JWQ97_2258 [Phenylobacterium sp.]|nr:hypothetical protein [Phenylobacterium sp.]